MGRARKTPSVHKNMHHVFEMTLRANKMEWEQGCWHEAEGSCKTDVRSEHGITETILLLFSHFMLVLIDLLNIVYAFLCCSDLLLKPTRENISWCTFRFSMGQKIGASKMGINWESHIDFCAVDDGHECGLKKMIDVSIWHVTEKNRAVQ